MIYNLIQFGGHMVRSMPSLYQCSFEGAIIFLSILGDKYAAIYENELLAMMKS